MDIKALRLEARFSLATNQLGYCGRGTAGKKFKKCITTGKCAGVEEEVTKFIVLYPYLKTLAHITGYGVFSYPVIEAFWIGNDELKKAKPDDFEVLLSNFSAQGVPKWLTDELGKDKPKVFIPHHLFQVLFVGVGRASGAVPFDLNSINNCMIRWGGVTSVNEKERKLEVKLNGLGLSAEKYNLEQKIESFSYLPELVPGISKGFVVAVHWGVVLKILNTGETERLSFWTNKVLENVTSGYPKPVSGK
jgi:hypothetical protein